MTDLQRDTPESLWLPIRSSLRSGAVVSARGAPCKSLRATVQTSIEAVPPRVPAGTRVAAAAGAGARFLLVLVSRAAAPDAVSVCLVFATAADFSHPTRLQRVGGQRVDGGLRAALHAAQLQEVERNACREYGVRRHFIPRARGDRRCDRAQLRLLERAVGDPRGRSRHLPDRTCRSATTPPNTASTWTF